MVQEWMHASSHRGGHHRGKSMAMNGSVVSRHLVHMVDTLFEIINDICSRGEDTQTKV